MVKNKKSDHEISNDRYTALNMFLDSYRDSDIIVPDEYNRCYTGLPLFDDDSVPRSFFGESDSYEGFARFHRDVQVGEDTYPISLDLRKDANENFWIAKRLKIIRKGPLQGDHLSEYFNCEASTINEVLAVFNSKKIVPAEQVYYDKIRDRHGVVSDLIARHEWDIINYDIARMSTDNNFLLRMSSMTNQNGDVKAQYGTILYQLLAYRNNNYKSLSKEDLDELDNLIICVSDGDLLSIKLSSLYYLIEHSSDQFDTKDKLYYAMKNPVNSSHFLNTEFLNSSNGGVANEQDTLQKLLRRHNITRQDK